jgi:hypothetical protein
LFANRLRFRQTNNAYNRINNELCIFNQQRHQADVTRNTVTSPTLQR